MRRLGRYICFIIFLLMSRLCHAQPGQFTVSDMSTPSSFPLVSARATAVLYYDPSDARVVAIAAGAFQKDILAITDKKISIATDRAGLRDYTVIAGTIGHCQLLDELIRNQEIDVSPIKDKCERFIIRGIEQKGKKILVVAGSDRRGTAYALFHLSRTMGVSPFVWWADVAPQKRKELHLSGSYISNEPSVRYRGIFINDEDWGLQPWAAKNMDRDIRDIGPKTYAKVFELMLRLKANYIWPAMHPCTKAFYYYKENPKAADDYAIIVGGSHCEPMLRNNVFEWSENFEHEYGRKPGEWRYDVNKEEIYKYWDDRVNESRNYESVYTVGMRGVHDGSMPGPKDPDEKLKLLETVIRDQRKILGLDLSKPAQEVPQIFVPYKEVLSLYRRGLKLDDDITIIWPDDNHGYIRQLPNEQERKRGGGHGVYYHLSYWGSPHDYLWLSSISPALIAYEMNKAFYCGASRLWVFNVGDIKPAELELQFAMDMAWDIEKHSPENALDYVKQWAGEIFGQKNAAEIAAIKKEYYKLAQECKPEHLGVSKLNVYSGEYRLKQYADLASRAITLRQSIAPALDAYFELVLYPVLGACLLNKKVVMTTKSETSLMQLDKPQANTYWKSARQAFDSILLLTTEYNTKIAKGKWNGIMDWHPRKLVVFNPPPDLDSLRRKSGSSKLTDEPPHEMLSFGSIDPAAFIDKNETGAVVIKEISGLGYGGKGVTAMPRLLDNWPNINRIDSVYVEYAYKLSAGTYTILVKCLPTFGIGSDKRLEYSVTLNDGKPVTGNIYTEAESSVWKENVIQGYSIGKTRHVLEQDGNVKIRISFISPDVVINAIEIYQ